MNRHELIRRMLRSKFFMIGFSVVLLIILISVFGPMFTVHNPTKAVLTKRLTEPQWFANGWSGNILGTDQLGQDVLTRLIVGSRSSLFIALSTVIICTIVGTILGVVSGYFGKGVDTIIMRIGDVQLSIPSTILAIAISAVLGPSVRNLILVLVITGWVKFARVVRSNVLVIRNMEFIQASRVLGSSDFRIMFTQILPNVLTPLIILVSQQFGFVILLEASLSFLGLGVPPPAPSWGVMIADGREYIATAPWVVLVPGIALMITVLAFNFLGDGIRDVLDPKMKH